MILFIYMHVILNMTLHFSDSSEATVMILCVFGVGKKLENKTNSISRICSFDVTREKKSYV